MAGTAEAFEVAYAPGLSDASSISDGGPPDADFPSFSDDEPQGDDTSAPGGGAPPPTGPSDA